MADTVASLSDAQIDELLNQAEVRLLEKQHTRQTKSVLAPQISNDDISNNSVSVTTKAPASKPAASALNNQQRQELSVRVPEARKSKKEMVRYPHCHRVALLLPDEILSQFN
jgi:hypothetical protein